MNRIFLVFACVWSVIAKVEATALLDNTAQSFEATVLRAHKLVHKPVGDIYQNQAQERDLAYALHKIAEDFAKERSNPDSLLHQDKCHVVVAMLNQLLTSGVKELVELYYVFVDSYFSGRKAFLQETTGYSWGENTKANPFEARIYEAGNTMRGMTMALLGKEPSSPISQVRWVNPDVDGWLVHQSLLKAWWDQPVIEEGFHDLLNTGCLGGLLLNQPLRDYCSRIIPRTSHLLAAAAGDFKELPNPQDAWEYAWCASGLGFFQDKDWQRGFMGRIREATKLQKLEGRLTAIQAEIRSINAQLGWSGLTVNKADLSRRKQDLQEEEKGLKVSVPSLRSELARKQYDLRIFLANKKLEAAKQPAQRKLDDHLKRFPGLYNFFAPEAKKETLVREVLIKIHDMKLHYPQVFDDNQPNVALDWEARIAEADVEAEIAMAQTQVARRKWEDTYLKEGKKELDLAQAEKYVQRLEDAKQIARGLARLQAKMVDLDFRLSQEISQRQEKLRAIASKDEFGEKAPSKKMPTKGGDDSQGRIPEELAEKKAIYNLQVHQSLLFESLMPKLPFLVVEHDAVEAYIRLMDQMYEVMEKGVDVQLYFKQLGYDRNNDDKVWSVSELSKLHEAMDKQLVSTVSVS